MAEDQNPRVRAVPRVSTTPRNLRCGTGSAGSGTVWENPTRGLPISNPMPLFQGPKSWVWIDNSTKIVSWKLMVTQYYHLSH